MSPQVAWVTWQSSLYLKHHSTETLTNLGLYFFYKAGTLACKISTLPLPCKKWCIYQSKLECWVVGCPEKNFFSSWPDTIQGMMYLYEKDSCAKFQIFIFIFGRLRALFLFSIGHVLKLTWDPMGDMHTILGKIVENRNIKEIAPFVHEAEPT